MIAQMVDCGVYLNCGREKAVASTKSFTSMLIVLSLISMWYNNNNNNYKIINSLRNIPEVI
jgi:glucosamine--fructose-6-phosphate aminotransferase (isomerizing)